MDKLFPPRSATSRHRSSSDFKNSFPALTIREKQIRKLSQEPNPKLLLDTSYINKPESHLPSADIKEVSLQLTVLKKNFDKQCTEWNKRDSFLGGLKSEMDKITAVEKRQRAFKEIKMLEIKSLREDIEKAIVFQEVEEDNREIFAHVLDRMRTTLVHLKSKTHGYKDSLHKRSFTLLTENLTGEKKKNSRVKTANAFVRLKNVIEEQTKEEKREVEELEKNVEKRKAVSSLRAERQKKQGEIIEKAMIESQSSRLEDIREKYFLNKMWYHLSTMRFDKEQLKFKKFEDAYLRIKLATGISDVPLFVEKFLTREKSYRSMLNSVKQKENDLVKYKEKIENMQVEVERFDSGVSVIGDDIKKTGEIHKLHKELRELNMKKINFIQVYDKISKWLARMRWKLNGNVKDFNFDEKTLNFHESMLQIKISVQKLLSGIDRERFAKGYMNMENLQEIIDDIPEIARSGKRNLSLIERAELLGLDTEPIVEEVLKKIKKN